jgi:hypothetical protein
MVYEVSERKGGDAGSWGVEAIDFEGDGDCFVTVFYGPEAEKRAQEYADWKNA